jgi:1-deoxy-D-xylulose-5-phosphate synthase
MEKLLPKIEGPNDLKSLTIEQLVALAEEVRQFIIDNVSKSGGHLAPSLGVVELTIALHHVFDSPVDRIIWDVGHQAYAHKILTGRRDVFHTNRQYKGISGFPTPNESPYDSFGVGHASTSISAGYGMVCARDLMGETFCVISVIGDGSMTGGLAFEGLNNAGASGKNFIVVLNDNSMSISKNVGAVSKYFTYLLTDPRFNRLKKEVWDLTGRLPRGQDIRKAVQKVDTGLKAMVAPGRLMERMGFRYIGPIDGHNIDLLVKVFNQVKPLKGPLFLHVITKKGKGYRFAEENATKFHGVGSFETSTGISNGIKKGPSYSEVFGKALCRLAQNNPSVVGITAAMADGTGLIHFQEEFPNRFFDVGIAEGHAVTMAAGLASQGFRPVVAIYSTFLQRAYDQVIHDVALQNLPVVFALDRAGLVGADGPTHHGCFDLSYLRNIPNLVIMAPSNGVELENMLATALSYTNGPIALRYPRGNTYLPNSHRSFQTIPIGKSEWLRQGNDGVILAVGRMVDIALHAADRLSESGLEVAVINARFIKPLDESLLMQLVDRHPRWITIEDNAVSGGFGSAVLEFLADYAPIGTQVLRLGLPDYFIPHGEESQLFHDLGLDVDGLVLAACDLFHSTKKVVPISYRNNLFVFNGNNSVTVSNRPNKSPH